MYLNSRSTIFRAFLIRAQKIDIFARILIRAPKMRVNAIKLNENRSLQAVLCQKIKNNEHIFIFQPGTKISGSIWWVVEGQNSNYD